MYYLLNKSIMELVGEVMMFCIQLNHEIPCESRFCLCILRCLMLSENNEISFFKVAKENHKLG